MTFAKDKSGRLAAFSVEADSFKDAIQCVKEELGVNRALCLVQNQPAAFQEPVKETA